MIEQRPLLTFITHALLIAGIVIMAFPIYIAFITSTQSMDVINAADGVIPLLPGEYSLENYKIALFGSAEFGVQPGLLLLWNSFLMALVIALGKIFLAVISAYAVVYFNFRFRMLFFYPNVADRHLMLDINPSLHPSIHERP